MTRRIDPGRSGEITDTPPSVYRESDKQWFDRQNDLIDFKFNVERTRWEAFVAWLFASP